MLQIQNIFDTHAHYDDERYDEDRDSLLTRIHQESVSEILNVGCSLSAIEKTLKIAEAHPFVYAGVGIHPEESGTLPSDYLAQVERFAAHPKVVAIGEIGLDYHYEDTDKPSQHRIFKEQLALAERLQLPVIIHSRDAVQDTIAFLKNAKNYGVVHCYSGSAETAQTYLELGYYLGFTGLVTFPKVKKVCEAITVTPLERILLETDCPYMAPVPYRGKRCSSEMIAYTAEAIARIKGVSTQEMIDIARQNGKRLFGI